MDVRPVLGAVPVHVRESEIAAGVLADQGSDKVRDVVGVHGVIAVHVTFDERASRAERINALARNRGLRQFMGRGLHNGRRVALLFALAHSRM